MLPLAMALLALSASSSNASSSSASSSAASSEAPASLRLRIDPAVAVVGGASVGFDVAVRDLGSRLSVAAFVVDIPRILVPLVVDAPPSMKITETALQVGWFTSFDDHQRGWFAGPELFAYRLRYVDEDAPARAAVATELYLHATAGYVWFPCEHGVWRDVFVMPWATVGLPVWKTGGVTFADATRVDDRAVNVHATVSLGLQLF